MVFENHRKSLIQLCKFLKTRQVSFRSTKIGGNAKIQKFKCDILGNFQTIWERVVGWSRVSFYKPELMKSVELCCTELWPKTAENAVFWQIDGLKSASFFTPRRLRLNWILFHTQVFKVTTLACTIVYAAKQVIVRFLLISRFFFLALNHAWHTLHEMMPSLRISCYDLFEKIESFGNFGITEEEAAATSCIIIWMKLHQRHEEKNPCAIEICRRHLLHVVPFLHSMD